MNVTRLASKPISNESVELNNCLLFLETEISSFNLRREVINPSQTATLPTSLEPYYCNKQKIENPLRSEKLT